MIDILSGVLGDVILGEVTVFAFVSCLSLMIHDSWLFSFFFRLIENDIIIAFKLHVCAYRSAIISLCFEKKYLFLAYSDEVFY